MKGMRLKMEATRELRTTSVIMIYSLRLGKKDRQQTEEMYIMSI